VAVTKEVARRIGLDPGVGEGLSKTFARWDGKGVPRGIAGNHIERIYTKIGASSRSTATLYAMQHGMLTTLEPLEPPPLG
jgi:hypothetical protein